MPTVYLLKRNLKRSYVVFEYLAHICHDFLSIYSWLKCDKAVVLELHSSHEDPSSFHYYTLLENHFIINLNAISKPTFQYLPLSTNLHRKDYFSDDWLQLHLTGASFRSIHQCYPAMR